MDSTTRNPVDPQEGQQKNNVQPSSPGPVIPAGTEQETGLTRGKTEIPEDLQNEEDSGREMNKEEKE